MFRRSYGARNHAAVMSRRPGQDAQFERSVWQIWRYAVVALYIAVCVASLSAVVFSSGQSSNEIGASAHIFSGDSDSAELAIYNGSGTAWKNVQVELDGGYVNHVDGLEPRDTISLAIDSFRAVGAVPRSEGIFSWEVAGTEPWPEDSAGGHSFRWVRIRHEGGSAELRLDR